MLSKCDEQNESCRGEPSDFHISGAYVRERQALWMSAQDSQYNTSIPFLTCLKMDERVSLRQVRERRPSLIAAYDCRFTRHDK